MEEKLFFNRIKPQSAGTVPTVVGKKRKRPKAIMSYKLYKFTCLFCKEPGEKKWHQKPVFCSQECAKRWRRNNGGSFASFPTPAQFSVVDDSFEEKYRQDKDPIEWI